MANRYIIGQRNTFWGKARWCVIDIAVDDIVSEGNRRSWALADCVKRNMWELERTRDIAEKQEVAE